MAQSDPRTSRFEREALRRAWTAAMQVMAKGVDTSTDDVTALRFRRGAGPQR